MSSDSDELRRDAFAVYRRALADAIARTSLRAVALAVGMSPSGLQNLVSGSDPYGKTRERVREWYVREVGFEQLPPREAAVLIRRLVAGLRFPRTAMQKVLQAVDVAYRDEGASPPPWVEAVEATLTAES